MLEYIGSLGYGGQWLNTKLPKALIELQGLKLSGPLAGVAANTAIAVTDGIEIQDTFVKVLGFSTANGFTDLTADTTIVDLRAQATLTIGAVAPGDSVMVNGKKYTFQSVVMSTSTNLAPGVIPIGQVAQQTAYALAQAIENRDQELTASVNGDVVTVIAFTAGTEGNAITLSVSGSNGHVTASGSTLAGGSVTNAIRISAATTGQQILMLWFMKDRNLLQP